MVDEPLRRRVVLPPPRLDAGADGGLKAASARLSLPAVRTPRALASAKRWSIASASGATVRPPVQVPRIEWGVTLGAVEKKPFPRRRLSGRIRQGLKKPNGNKDLLPLASKHAEWDSESTDRRRMSRPVHSRGRNLFKQKDVVRAMRSAEAGGLAISGVEVVTKDGITIRVFGKDVGRSANPWDEVLTNAADEKRPA
jgi:hypothetical protein